MHMSIQKSAFCLTNRELTNDSNYPEAETGNGVDTINTVIRSVIATAVLELHMSTHCTFIIHLKDMCRTCALNMCDAHTDIGHYKCT